MVKVTEKEHMGVIKNAEKRVKAKTVKPVKVKTTRVKGQEAEPFDSPAASRVGGRPRSLKAIMINPDDAHLVTEAVEQIEVLHKSITSHCEQAFMDAAACGAMLCGVKARLKFGEFGQWVANNITFIKTRTVQNYMLLHLHHKELLLQNITSITDAYAAIKGEPSPSDPPPDADDSTDTKGEIVVANSTIDLDNIKLPPKKKPQGQKGEFPVDAATIKAMREQTFPHENTKGTYIKIVVRLPIPKSKQKLLGEFVIVVQTLLKSGGKLIFHNKAKK